MRSFLNNGACVRKLINFSTVFVVAQVEAGAADHMIFTQATYIASETPFISPAGAWNVIRNMWSILNATSQIFILVEALYTSVAQTYRYNADADQIANQVAPFGASGGFSINSSTAPTSLLNPALLSTFRLAGAAYSVHLTGWAFAFDLAL
jgi:hypothetical protein